LWKIAICFRKARELNVQTRNLPIRWQAEFVGCSPIPATQVENSHDEAPRKAAHFTAFCNAGDFARVAKVAEIARDKVRSRLTKVIEAL
jgi:hypothetical protein